MQPDYFYFQRIKDLTRQLNKLKRRLFTFSLVRFVSSLVIGGVLLYLLKNADALGIGFLVMTVGVFAVLVRHYKSISQEKHLVQQLVKINLDESKALKGEYSENLHSSLDHSHPYAHDLDIVGTHSLFGMVNRTCCPASNEQLLTSLCHPSNEKDKIIERQQAIKELAGKVIFRQEFMAIGSLYREADKDTREFMNWLSGTDVKVARKAMRLASVALGLVTLILVMLAFLEHISHNYWMIMFAINLIFFSILKKRGGAITPDLANKIQFLKKYCQLLERVSIEDFQDEYLKHTTRKSGLAHHEISKLIKILRFNRANNFVTQGLFLPDLHLVAAIEKWRRKNGKEAANWLESIYLLDELNSFANFAFNCPEFTYPTFSEESFLKAEGLGHPFLYTKGAVINSFSPDTRAVVLTGANMSGKSTFLRCVGINLVLAYAGAPVFAQKFECRIASIFTSMRITDNLESNSSYFYAELHRLSAIMEELRQNKPVIILLDEVLKGTNSEDKLEGSIGLVEGFSAFDCLSIIATHDLAMGKLESQAPDSISNYCFESQLIQNELHFDFKIRKGLAKNKNASFLMRRMNLID